jgi:hypothetical protein
LGGPDTPQKRLFSQPQASDRTGRSAVIITRVLAVIRAIRKQSFGTDLARGSQRVGKVASKGTPTRELVEQIGFEPRKLLDALVWRRPAALRPGALP